MLGEVRAAQALRERAGSQKSAGRQAATPWGWALLAAALFALVTGAFAGWWAGPALVGGMVIIAIGNRPQALLFAGSLLWALALTGLPLAGRPAPLLSTVLAFAGTRAYRDWRKATATQSKATVLGPAGQGAVTGAEDASAIISWVAWLCGLGGTAVLALAWLGRIQIFPALDASLATVQLGAAAGLASALEHGIAREGRRLVLLPLGLSIVSLGVLFWWFVLAA